MVELREEEGDAHLPQDLRLPLRFQRDSDAEFLQGIGGAGLRGRRPRTVLDHLRSRRGRHQGRHGGDVDGVGPVTPRAHHVHGLPVEGDLERVVEHRGAEALDLVLRLPLRPQGHQQGRELHLAGAAREDLVERPLRGLGFQTLTAHQPRQDVRPGVGHATFSRSNPAT